MIEESPIIHLSDVQVLTQGSEPLEVRELFWMDGKLTIVVRADLPPSDHELKLKAITDKLGANMPKANYEPFTLLVD